MTVHGDHRKVHVKDKGMTCGYSVRKNSDMFNILVLILICLSFS